MSDGANGTEAGSGRSAAAMPLVYIVEDDAAIRSALLLLVRSYGWQARAFASGVDFLDSGFEEHGACLVLDLNMPVITGEEVLLQLRRRGSQLPVVVITAETQATIRDRALKAGARCLIAKPFRDEVLHEAVTGCFAAH